MLLAVYILMLSSPNVNFLLSYSFEWFVFSEAPLPPIKFPVRQLADAEQWGPTIQVLTDAEMEKKMRDQDRNTRSEKIEQNACTHTCMHTTFLVKDG